MSNAQIIKNNALMNCTLAFDRRRQTSFLSLKSLERAKQILTHALAYFNIQKKMPRVGPRARVTYIELGFSGTNIDPQLG